MSSSIHVSWLKIALWKIYSTGQLFYNPWFCIKDAVANTKKTDQQTT